MARPGSLDPAALLGFDALRSVAPARRVLSASSAWCAHMPFHNRLPRSFSSSTGCLTVCHPLLEMRQPIAGVCPGSWVLTPRAIRAVPSTRDRPILPWALSPLSGLRTQPRLRGRTCLEVQAHAHRLPGLSWAPIRSWVCRRQFCEVRFSGRCRRTAPLSSDPTAC